MEGVISAFLSSSAATFKPLAAADAAAGHPDGDAAAARVAARRHDARLDASATPRCAAEGASTDRFDYKLIEEMVPDGATVLDLGCGDGELLAELVRDRHVQGSGVDVDPAAVEACVGRGLSVFHGDLDEGLADYLDGSIEVVILSFSLQQLRRPRMLVREMARVGRLAIVSFPNFAHWSVRGQLLAAGACRSPRNCPTSGMRRPTSTSARSTTFATCAAAKGCA